MQSYLFVRAKLVLTRTKLAPRGISNSKELESKSPRTRWGGRVGRACGTAGPRTSPSDARENFLPEKRTNTNPIHRARPAGRPVGSACGFLSRTDAGQVRLEPTANGTWRETSLNHRHFVDAHRYRMFLRAQGGFRGWPYTPRSSSWLVSLCQRVQAPASRRSKNNLLWPRYALLTARFDSPCNWHGCELWLSS